jgi:hypothetical protein
MFRSHAVRVININTGSDIQITIMLKDCNHHEIQNLIKLDV